MLCDEGKYPTSDKIDLILTFFSFRIELLRGQRESVSERRQVHVNNRRRGIVQVRMPDRVPRQELRNLPAADVSDRAEHDDEHETSQTDLSVGRELKLHRDQRQGRRQRRRRQARR